MQLIFKKTSNHIHTGGNNITIWLTVKKREIYFYYDNKQLDMILKMKLLYY